MWMRVKNFMKRFLDINRLIELVFMGITAVATVCMAITSWQSIKIGNDVAVITRESVAISESLAKQNLTRLQAELRPYLIVQLMPGVNEGLQKDGNSQLSLVCIDSWHFTLPFRIRNVGKMPAINVDAQYITPTQESSFAVGENSISPDSITSEIFYPWLNISNQVNDGKPFTISVKITYKGNDEVDARGYYSLLILTVVKRINNIYEIKKVESKFGYVRQEFSALRESRDGSQLNNLQDIKKENGSKGKVLWLRDMLIPFYTLFCIFIIFVYQEINNRIRRGCDNFRDWVKYRLDEGKDEAGLLKVLGMDKEPYSWLEKDVVFQMFYFYKKVHFENIKPYLKASKDYYIYIREYLRFKEHIFVLLLILTILMIVVISFQWTNILFGYYFLIFWAILWVLRGAKLDLKNNCVENRLGESCLKGVEKEIKELKQLVKYI